MHFPKLCPEATDSVYDVVFYALACCASHPLPAGTTAPPRVSRASRGSQTLPWKEGGREGVREGWKEGGREGRIEGGRD